MSHKLRLGTHRVSTANLSKPVKVRARNSARNSARRTPTVDISLAGAGAALASALTGGGRLTVALSGAATVGMGFGKVPLSFDTTRTLSVTGR